MFVGGVLTGVLSALNHHSETPPTTAISKISATIAARNAILIVRFKTKNVAAAIANIKNAKIIAAIVINFSLFRLRLFPIRPNLLRSAQCPASADGNFRLPNRRNQLIYIVRNRTGETRFPCIRFLFYRSDILLLA